MALKRRRHEWKVRWIKFYFRGGKRASATYYNFLDMPSRGSLSTRGMRSERAETSSFGHEGPGISTGHFPNNPLGKLSNTKRNGSSLCVEKNCAPYREVFMIHWAAWCPISQSCHSHNSPYRFSAIFGEFLPGRSEKTPRVSAKLVSAPPPGWGGITPPCVSDIPGEGSHGLIPPGWDPLTDRACPRRFRGSRSVAIVGTFILLASRGTH